MVHEGLSVEAERSAKLGAAESTDSTVNRGVLRPLASNAATRNAPPGSIGSAAAS